MQIIIHQAEIEEAIRNHILTQLHVREGMKISIDLAATRGDTGFRATIDIKPADPSEIPAATAVVVEAAPAPAAPLAMPAAAVRVAGQVVTRLVHPASAAPAPVIRGATPEERARIMEEVHAASEAAEAEAEAEAGAAEEAPAAQEAPVAVATEAVADPDAAAFEEPKPAPAPARAPSLFKGLRKPVNS